MKPRSTLLIALSLSLLPALSAVAATPPLLPATASFEDMAVAASTTREFEVDLLKSEKYLAWQIKSAVPQGTLSGTLLLAMADGQPLDERPLDGLVQTGGLVPLPAGTASRRIRVTLRGGQRDMRVDMSLLPRRATLNNGQAATVFARRRGSDAFAGSFELRLATKADLDVVTWGGDATATLRVKGPAGKGFPDPRCEDSGDAWRHCTLPALPAGSYQVYVEGSGSPVNVVATWKVEKTP